MPSHIPPLWSAELEGSGSSSSKVFCKSCKKWVSVDLAKYGTWSPLQPCDHWCNRCIAGISKKFNLSFIPDENLKKEAQNDFGG